MNFYKEKYQGSIIARDGKYKTQLPRDMWLKIVQENLDGKNARCMARTSQDFAEASRTHEDNVTPDVTPEMIAYAQKYAQQYAQKYAQVEV